MAKGLRSSTKKANKSILRRQVFGPVEEARKERLSVKLLELASKSQAISTEKDIKMIDGNQEASERRPVNQEVLPTTTSEDMDMDGRSDAVAIKSSKSKRAGRVQKRGQKRASATFSFPVYKKGNSRRGDGGQKQHR